MQKARLFSTFIGALFPGALVILPAHAGGRVLTTSDVVTIRVLNEPELTTTTRVEPDGTVNFAYVGRIKAAGLTEDELAGVIESRLVERGILARPYNRGDAPPGEVRPRFPTVHPRP